MKESWHGPRFEPVFCTDPAFIVCMECTCAYILLWCKAKSTQQFHFLLALLDIRAGTSPELGGSCPYISMHTVQYVIPTNSFSLPHNSLSFRKLLLGPMWQYLTTRHSIRPEQKCECQQWVPLPSICMATPATVTVYHVHMAHPRCPPSSPASHALLCHGGKNA